MTNFELYSLISSSIAALGSIGAVFVAVSVAKEQGRLTRLVHENQMTLSQRQLFIEIWPKIESLNEINCKTPVAVDVVKAVNVLELVALCWESNMVDGAVLMRAFGERFVHFYDDIVKVPTLANPNKSGSDLIRENPAIGNLYDELRRLRQAAGVPEPLRLP